jgi:hypothetical protein
MMRDFRRDHPWLRGRTRILIPQFNRLLEMRVERHWGK